MENTNTLSWDSLSPVEQDCETYSDMYKDLYGIRPYLTNFRKMDDEQRAAEIDSIGREIEATIAAEREQEFEDSICEQDKEAFDHLLRAQFHEDPLSLHDCIAEPYEEYMDLERM